MDISKLVRKAKEGDQNAQEEILLQLRPYVYKQAKSIYIKGYEMEDLLQLGNLSILKALRQYEERPGRSFIPYVLTAVNNNFYYEIRQKCRLNEESSLHNGGEEGEDWIYNLPDHMNVEEELARKGNIQEVRKVLSKLSPEEREIIEALYFKEISLKELAARKGLNYITLVKRKNRLLLRMRKEMGGERIKDSVEDHTHHL